MSTGPSSDIPNRMLTPEELKQFKRDQELKKLLDGVEQEFTKRAEIPAKWFGRLLAVLVVAIFIDLTGWISAFLDGGFYAALAFIRGLKDRNTLAQVLCTAATMEDLIDHMWGEVTTVQKAGAATTTEVQQPSCTERLRCVCLEASHRSVC